jgi:hypothetical protein
MISLPGSCHQSAGTPYKLIEHRASLLHVELPPSALSPKVLHSFSLTAISCVVSKQQGVPVWQSIRDATEGLDTIPWIPTKHGTAVLRGQQCQGNERLWSQCLEQQTLAQKQRR